jgi:hypothetical protein
MSETGRKSDEPAPYAVGCLLGVLCAIIGGVLGCYWGIHVTTEEFARAKAEGRFFDALPVMPVGGIILGAPFGWTVGWLLAAFLRRKRMRIGRGRIQFWAFGLFPIAMLTVIIAIFVIVALIEGDCPSR